jgi:hypothetical protein
MNTLNTLKQVTNQGINKIKGVRENQGRELIAKTTRRISIVAYNTLYAIRDTNYVSTRNILTRIARDTNRIYVTNMKKLAYRI